MERNKQIDFLRFVGIFLVLFRHLEIQGDTNEKLSIIEYALKALRGGGWMGVDLFFVLSGFLVSSLIFNEYKKTNTFKPLNFLIRRGFKIYPMYYLILGISFIYCYLLDIKFNPNGLLSDLFFISNYTGQSNYGILWSIAVEEHFYLFLSVITYLLISTKALKFTSISLIYLLLLYIAIGFRIYNYINTGIAGFGTSGIQSHTRFDSLFFGVLLSYLYNFNTNSIDKLLSYKKILLPLTLSFICIHFVFSQANNNWIVLFSLSILPLCFGYLLIYLLSCQKLNQSEFIKPFAYLGTYSYSIYLCHKIIHDICLKYFDRYNYYIVYILISFIVGVFMSKLIEYPILKLRNKLFPKSTQKVV